MFRRYKTKNPYELFHGNLVIVNELPGKLLDMFPQKTEREFKVMRYTSATCGPNDFKADGDTLHPVMYEPACKTELFIVTTMYKVDEELLCLSRSDVGKRRLEKVAVCIVSDRYQMINSRTLSVVPTMTAYQDGVAKHGVNNKPVTAHTYEYTDDREAD
ncbi:SubName: Full=Related to chitin Synthase 4 {ECO:0000313/EMBL:CCA71557.1} [Serendipita indica DSM 11827]|uniref:Chitin synthase n=1 Tax=Serendipita indica (strain DSM 11827) TaxID=1109443 RepID=G4TJR4_SERID|nr:SubName: Full=Related to chitin Synthase 4 {ECO:0000313/EMBL:CCA71557.1} [Serendipita indica DSM 11827]CCA71557.1 related to chitin Synthase 4 [Serendipita indica DSM 11827]